MMKLNQWLHKHSVSPHYTLSSDSVPYNVAIAQQAWHIHTLALSFFIMLQLTHDQRIQIIMLFNQGGHTALQLAAQFNCNRSYQSTWSMVSASQGPSLPQKSHFWPFSKQTRWNTFTSFHHWNNQWQNAFWTSYSPLQKTKSMQCSNGSSLMTPLALPSVLE